MERQRFRVPGRDFSDIRTHLLKVDVLVEAVPGVFFVEGASDELSKLLSAAGNPEVTFEPPKFITVEEHQRLMAELFTRLSQTHPEPVEVE